MNEFDEKRKADGQPKDDGQEPTTPPQETNAPERATAAENAPENGKTAPEDAPEHAPAGEAARESAAAAVFDAQGDETAQAAEAPGAPDVLVEDAAVPQQENAVLSPEGWPGPQDADAPPAEGWQGAPEDAPPRPEGWTNAPNAQGQGVPPAYPNQGPAYPPQPPYGYRPPYGQPYQQYPHPSQYRQPPYGYSAPGPMMQQKPPANRHVHPGVPVTGMMPKSPPREPGPKNKGLRVFIVILALVIAATGLTAAGYFAGQRSSGRPGATASAKNESKSGGLGIDIIERGASENDENLGSQAANAAATKVSPSVVGITIYSMTHKETGSEATGIVLTKDGYILTNDHVYADVPNAKFLIETSNKKEYEAKFIAGDSRSDLAVLKIAGVSDLTPATFADSDELAVGENVIAVGNPYGRAYAGTVTKGIISAVNRRVTGEAGSYSMKCIQTDTAINPGNSGGPLVNMEGQVVGINSSKIVATGYEGIGFAIPSVTALKAADSLVKNGYVADRAKLGISYQAITTVTGLQNDMPTGLYIAEISKESDMNGKGVAIGDIITHVSGTEIKSGEEILDVIEESRPGDTIQITVYHAASKQSGKVLVKLLADKGSSSYQKVDESASSNKNPFFR